MPSAVTANVTRLEPSKTRLTDDNAAAAGEADDNNDNVADSEAIPTHPLGVKPLGNLYFFEGVNARKSIGSWGLLPDEMLMIVLEHMDKSTLLSLSHTCKFFYAVCHSEELWKTLFLQ